MDAIVTFINWLDDFIWGIPMIVLLLGTHLFMTARTGFIQRKLFTGIRLSVTKDPDSPGDVSQFQALTTALASTIGTGNIIGVGTAIFLGGPGAVFCAGLPACSASPPSTPSPSSPSSTGCAPGTAKCRAAPCTPWSGG